VRTWWHSARSGAAHRPYLVFGGPAATLALPQAVVKFSQLTRFSVKIIKKPGFSRNWGFDRVMSVTDLVKSVAKDTQSVTKDTKSVTEEGFSGPKIPSPSLKM